MLDLVLKAVATALAVALAGRLAARGGAFAAAMAMAIPLNAAPGFLLVILEGHDAAFVERAALTSFAGCGAVLVFSALYVRLSRRRRLRVALPLAVAGWLALALPITLLPASLPVALALIGVGGVATALLWDGSGGPIARPPAAATWRFLVLRGLVLGLTVTVVAKTAGAIGPVAAGLAFAFPLVIISTALVLEMAYGRTLSVATVAEVPRTLWIYAAFVLELYVAAPRIGTLPAWLVAGGVVVPIAGLLTIAAFRPGARLRPRRP